MRWWILIATGIYYNCYFGWNASAASDAEMVCDMLYSIMAIMCFNHPKVEP